jgi:Tol biopolymer transport system component
MNPSAPAAVGATPVMHSDRLDSWKEIAAYLKRGVTTVQRWEREEGLPVHRQQHDSLGSVYAYKQELEAWRQQRAVATERDDPGPEESALTNRRSLPWQATVLSGATILIGVLALVGTGAVHFGVTAMPKVVRHLTIVPPSTAPMSINGLDRNLAIAPDGSRVVYVGGTGTPRLFVRALDQLETTPIAGVFSSRSPFFSPDGQWIGFFEGFTSLKKVAVSGGPATELTYVNIGGDSGPRGASWGPNHRIAFAIGDRLLLIPDDGGKPELLAVADHAKGEAAYWWPEFLPGGRSLLFTILPSGDGSEKGLSSATENAQIAVLDLRTGKRKVLLDGGSHARYLESGHLVYAAEGTVRAVAFDLRKLAIVGNPKTVIPQVAMSRGGAANFDVARDGTLVYMPGEVENDLVTLAWVDRHGNEEPVGTPAFSYRYARLSPGAARVVLGSPRDLGVWDFSNGKLTWFGIGYSTYPVWTPDGQNLIFATTRAGAANIYRQSIDGHQPLTRLTTSPYNQFPNAVSPDGAYLVFREDAASSDLMLLDLRKQRTEPLVQTPFMEMNADISPDGTLLAYQSNESGQNEVYVQSFPKAASKPWKVSDGGGTRPQWAPNGRELFYFSSTGALTSLPIQRQGGAFTLGTSATLFNATPYLITGMGGRTYDVSPDGARFLMTKPARPSGFPGSGRNMEIVLNWFEEIRRAVPTPALP